MATIRELRKRLSSISVTEQLTGAMKTVSAAKYSKIESVRSRSSSYANVCRSLLARYEVALNNMLVCKNPDAPACYVVFSSNRGFCGGYNSELFRFAEETLSAVDQTYHLIVCGKMGEGYFGNRATERYILPDVPEFSDCIPLFERICSAYTSGEISSVTILYMHLQNMLTMIPTKYTVLPFSSEKMASEQNACEKQEEEMLLVPDRDTVLSSVSIRFLYVSLHTLVLEAAAGAQAATLNAMRSASDNAAEMASKLNQEISRKRQAEVTSSILETASTPREL